MGKELEIDVAEGREGGKRLALRTVGLLQCVDVGKVEAREGANAVERRGGKRRCI